ncbi:uncharacterized protein A4U43_C07F25960 [Asparagus officinalis]|uniref:Viral late gene transcription factor 3 zinc ribbon domain-containing protein n=1 Tax=Asparagus officinalis TaxID=4686 RepID=A0A5P1EIC9_ASPOF|nr:uncharacterized protein LOC109850989 [Asparagus officinalis]XP_020276671.1 uncharacterized protein LOC109850989 [Asparagus officinalis]ONK64441.1 uncharacterized protein A4U43_C07F25960 [Asparagus officinalis]
MLSSSIQHCCCYYPSSRNTNRNSGSRRSLSHQQRANAIESHQIAPVEISWQIAVGSIAGITPFIVAGIEFSKRIRAQRKCEICRGSGLVQDDDVYIRCPNCGGFLPWQTWKRFFTG